MHWATYIVALGALMGIVTSTLVGGGVRRRPRACSRPRAHAPPMLPARSPLPHPNPPPPTHSPPKVGMYGASRIITGVARDHMLPPFMARVGRFKTPWLAILAQGLATATLALFSSFDELADMVSISTLFAFWMVALGVVWRRSCTHGAGSVVPSDGGAPAGGAGLGRRRALTAVLLFLINAGAIIFTVGWRLEDFRSTTMQALLGVGAGVALLSTAALHALVKPLYTPPRYTAPLYPWLPALSMMFNIFLIGQLSVLAFERFGIWSAACIAVYLLYSATAAYNKAERHSSKLPRQAADLADTKAAGAPAAIEMASSK
jgi:amino acid transporter